MTRSGRWSLAELEALRAAYAARPVDALTLAQRLGRLPQSVRDKARRAGLSKRKRARLEREASTVSGPPCAWCGGPRRGRIVRAMHSDCYRKALASGRVLALRPSRRAPRVDPLDEKIEAILRRRAA